MASAAIYLRLVRSRIRSRLQYRVSFAMQIIGAFLLTFLDFIGIAVMFHHLPKLAGWSLGEIAFLYGSSYVAFKCADMLMGNLDKLPTMIRMGTIDQVLTRPLGSLGQVLTGDIDARHVGGIAQGAIVLSFGVSRVDIDWTPQRIGVFAMMLASGLVIFCSLWIATNALAFWVTDAREIANSFTYGGNFMTQFPITIYGTWLRRLFAYAVPLAFVNYFPSLYILDHPDPGPGFLRFMSPLVALGVALVARGIWQTAVRHYRSTGS